MEHRRTERYLAAGGVVVHDNQVLVLRRPHRAEVRLPKGHVEPGEDAAEAAIRETQEESGYQDVRIIADLGIQEVVFDFQGRHIERIEHYFLMNLTSTADDDAVPDPVGGEPQFDPIWLPWNEAMDALSFPAEKEWVRRAYALSARGYGV
ncbi:MAG: NUDIX domain-containing protein [Chloroflexi bacterium]|nr:NUDIX domain-containing protein [Chloroflexota bacterium]